MCVCDSVRGGAGASVQDRVGQAEARRRQGVWHEGRGEGQEGAGSRATARRRDSPERPQKSGADGGAWDRAAALQRGWGREGAAFGEVREEDEGLRRDG